MKKPFFISTAIPYVNAEPHIGFAFELVEADAIARFKRLFGRDVFFLTGTDENSLKNVQAAEKAGLPVGQFVNDHAEHFSKLKDELAISFDGFIRTSDKDHFKGAQKLWSACKPEDIYKKKYKGLYCVGCEAFYTSDDLIDGLCPEHKVAPEEVEEENYFFKLSNYQSELKRIIESDEIKITPQTRKNEVLAFIDRGLEDFSISRSEERARGWGVPVPGDESQIMYVWFDALSNYITGLGFAEDAENYKKYWIQNDQREVVHVIGKGITRFHAIYWIAMLLSAEIPLPTDIVVHGYLTINGEKMSKSLGNVLHPSDVVTKYGVDPVRYYLLGAVSSTQDGDFSIERFEELYTAHLANGIGNLTSRVLTMLEKYTDGKVPDVAEDIFDTPTFWDNYEETAGSFEWDKAIGYVNKLVSLLDATISEEKPWEKAKAGEDINPLLYQLAEGLRHLGLALLPVIPVAAAKILANLSIDATTLRPLEEEKKWGGLKPGTAVTKGEPLFPRLSLEKK